MLDSGSFMCLARQDLVPVNSVDYSKQEDILCVHGDKHPYPTAKLTVTIDDQGPSKEDPCVQPLPDFDNSLFDGGTNITNGALRSSCGWRSLKQKALCQM